MGWFDDLFGNDTPAAAPEGAGFGGGSPQERHNVINTSATGAHYPSQNGPVTPQLPSTPLGMLATAGSPVGAMARTVGSSLMNQTKYGMNDASAANYQALLKDPANAGKSTEDLVHEARMQYRNSTPSANLPHGMNDQQIAVLNEQRAQEGLPAVTNQLFGGQGGVGGVGAGASIPAGASAGAQGGQFKPVTFRSGTGTATLTPEGLTTELAEPYAGLSSLVGEGTGLMGEASGLAQQAPDQFNYNFDPSSRATELFDQRSALLEPAFAQQRAKMNEGMFGSGRLGLRLAGEGAGAGSGMVQPDAFGMNQAQSQALSQLAAQSTTDAFGESMQRAGLDLSQFGANQQQKQQQFANLMGSGQGMLSAGLQAPALEQSLQGVPLQTEALRQNYELGLDKNNISRMLAQAQADQANYQPDPWLTGLTSLGTSFLGTNAGGDWLSQGFGKGGWFS